MKTLYRAKGFVYAAEKPHRRLVLQLVGRRATIAVDGPWEEQELQTRLVFIAGRGTCNVQAMEGKSIQHPTELLLNEFGESQVTYKISVWIKDPWLSSAFRSNLHEAIWRALKDAGIERPYPQLEVHFDKGVQIGNIHRSSSSGA